MAELISTPTLSELEARLPVVNWNYAELKELAREKAEEYANIAYTDEQETILKKDRASLNKFVTSIEDFRKQAKKIYMVPYNQIEEQVKDVLAPMRETISLMDTQLTAIDEARKEEKKSEIGKIFDEMDFPEFVQLQQIWSDKWLNKSKSISQIKAELDVRLTSINGAIVTIEALPEKELALEFFKKSLDAADAVWKAQEHIRMQKAKEEARRAQEEARAAQEEAKKEEKPEPSQPSAGPDPSEEAYAFTFKVIAKPSQYGELNSLIRQLKEVVGAENVITVGKEKA